MDVSGLNVPRLKQNVLEKWQSAPELWPVKVISLAGMAKLEAKNGGRKIDSVGGYFTCIRAIRGRTVEEMEDLLGFTRGYLGSGASVLKFSRLPEPNEFELRGYSQLPGGEPFDGVVLRRSDQKRPQFFDKAGKDLTFIPGLAVEQWEIKRGFFIPAVELERVMPGLRFTKWR